MTNDELSSGHRSDIDGLYALLPATARQYHEIVRDQEALNSLARWPLLQQVHRPIPTPSGEGPDR